LFLLDIGDEIISRRFFAAKVEQVYKCDSESFLARLDEHRGLQLIHRGHEVQVYRGLFQFVILSYSEVGDELLVRFRPSITMFGLLVLSSMLVAGAFYVSWWMLIVELLLISLAFVVYSSQLTWELLQFTQESITLRTQSSSNG